MEFLAVIFLVGVTLYCAHAYLTKRGTYAVRAFLYLAALDNGASVEEANEAASIDIVNAPTYFIRSAKLHADMAYDGKQLAMIADAKRQGLRLR